ncbi:hypothetical protein HRI_004494600 [Hibiscus trionum]|uniref:TF-B3 domain-containing protein n=1 Tax=Hibiscus trionum TaxID=183268 RepID=A0A9W7J7E6_HIBTR|nr:hypothetical protein HRI_004494600 [Hibiscus trionum]
MAIEELFEKTLTKTDTTKRLSVPTKKKTCFLDFGGRHSMAFKAMDSNGTVWPFGCSKRKKKEYPKPVLSKGWLQFVRYWKLKIGDKVIFYRQTMDKAGNGNYIIKVIRREPLPLPRNRDADKTMAVASYRDNEDEATITSDFTDKASANIEEEATMTSCSTDQAMTYDQTEGLHNQHGFMFEFISLKPDIAVNERKFIELGLQEQREEDHLCILTLQNISTDEIPVTSSTVPYLVFL